MSEQNRPDDQELEEFIAGRGKASQRYREAVERERPPEALDDAILGQARRALESDQRAKRRRFVVPLALAATVVLSFSVFVGVRTERAGSANIALSEEDKAVIARPAPPEATQMPAPAAPPAIAEAAATRRNALPSEREFARAQARVQQEEDQRKAERMEAPASAMVAPPPPATAAAPVGGYAARSVQQQAESSRESAAPSMAADAMADRAEGSAGRAASVAVEPVKSAPPKSLAKKRQRGDRSAAAELERIRALKEKGEMDEARAEMEEFRKDHPDAEIPDDLKPLTRPVTPPTP